MEPEPHDDVLRLQSTPSGDPGHRVAQSASGGDEARAAATDGGLGEEERDDAVAGVAADQAARVDDALLAARGKAPHERE